MGWYKKDEVEILTQRSVTTDYVPRFSSNAPQSNGLSVFQARFIEAARGCGTYASNAVRIISTSAADAELEPKKSLPRQRDKAASGGKIWASRLA
jgi:hypothetical protein